MTISKIIIAGAGQLGSRYLQGLARCNLALQIHVLDIDTSSVVRAGQRWNEVASLDTKHCVFFHSNISELPVDADIAIIATTAAIRPALVQAIAQYVSVRFWILEKVLAQSEDGLDVLASAVASSVGAWVNTPRRMLAWHQDIGAQLQSGKPLTLKVFGGAWGLACNAIHFLDMLAWWSGESLQEILTSQLHSHWIDAKRAGNSEVMGTLEANFSGGSRAILHASEGEVHYQFELDDGVHQWCIDEAAGTAVRSDGLALPGRLPFQSEVSAAMVEEILLNGRCALPTLTESISLHRVLIRALLAHWRASTDVGASIVPIT